MSSAELAGSGAKRGVSVRGQPLSQRALAQAIVADLLDGEHQGALAVVAGGSFLTPLASRSSDLDLIVLHARVAQPRMETLRVRGVLVELFVLDPSGFRFVSRDVDARAGAAPLAEMLHSGVLLHGDASPEVESLRVFARDWLAAGPQPLSSDIIAAKRYEITTLLADLEDAVATDEALAIGVRLYTEIGDFHLRLARRWSSSGKHLMRKLRAFDPVMAIRIDDALRGLARGERDAQDVFRALAADVLEPAGGELLTGFSLALPPMKDRVLQATG